MTLSYAQPTDTVVTLTSSDPEVTVPATVTIPAGQTSVPFTITARTLPHPTDVTLTATLGTEIVTSTVAAGPIGVRSVTSQHSSLRMSAGTTSGYVNFWIQQTPPATVTLTSSDPHLTVPGTVVTDGKSAAQFPIRLTGTLTAPVTVTSLPATTATVSAPR